jgi:hypothetical protein
VKPPTAIRIGVNWWVAGGYFQPYGAKFGQHNHPVAFGDFAQLAAVNDMAH